MLTDDQVREFHERGFLNIGNVIDDRICDLLFEEIFKVANGDYERAPVRVGNLNSDDNNMVLQIVNMWQASDAYLDHAKRRVITEAVAQLTGSDVLRIWHDQVQYKPGRAGGPTGWHQDFPLWPILAPGDLISAWVPMADAMIANGCMWMVPGSHLWGDQQRHLGVGEDFAPIHRQPSQLPPNARLEAVPIEVKKGECHLHHCLTWHGSRENRSRDPRPAIAVHYMPAHIRYEPVGPHIMEEYVRVPKGVILSGYAFPVVFERGAA